MNEQQKQNLADLYGYIDKYLLATGKTSDDYFSLKEAPDAYLITNLKEILDFELAKNESLKATVATLTSELQTYEELEWQARNAAWKPIETAPKDGSMVLLCRNVGGANPCNYRSVGEWCEDRYWTTDFADCIDGNIEDKPPTHWMPLPMPPILKKYL